VVLANTQAYVPIKAWYGGGHCNATSGSQAGGVGIRGSRAGSTTRPEGARGADYDAD